jgi:hypothetical protein
LGVIDGAMIISTDIKTNGELKAKIIAAAVDNHIWINAFSLIRPTDETLIGIGRAVVQMLQNKDNLLPSYHGEKDSEPIGDLQTLTGMLYMSVNQS